LGADPNARDNDDNTSLHLASKNGHVEVAEMLLDRGVDANARDNDSTIPLHFASQGGHLKIVRMLLDHCADVNVRDKNDKTPLHCVLQDEDVSCVSLDALNLFVDTNARKALAVFLCLEEPI
jgi:ankyrin repeat protein